MKLLKLGSYFGLPLGVIAFLASSIWMHQASTVPHPEKGLIVPLSEHGSYLYVTQLMNEAFYASCALLGVGVICTIILGSMKRHN